MFPLLTGLRAGATAQPTFFKLRMTSSCGSCSSIHCRPFTSPVRLLRSRDGAVKPLLRLAWRSRTGRIC